MNLSLIANQQTVITVELPALENLPSSVCVAAFDR